MSNSEISWLKSMLKNRRRIRMLPGSSRPEVNIEITEVEINSTPDSNMVSIGANVRVVRETTKTRVVVIRAVIDRATRTRDNMTIKDSTKRVSKTPLASIFQRDLLSATPRKLMMRPNTDKLLILPRHKT